METKQREHSPMLAAGIFKTVKCKNIKKIWTNNNQWVSRTTSSQKTNYTGGDLLGSVVKKRRKKMRKHKHKKLLVRTRHQRRKGK